jgi:hypothetical protein
MATTAEIQADLSSYRAARDTILNGAQTYKIGSRALTRGDLVEINREIRRLETRLAIAQNGGSIPGSSVVFGGHRG